ncbi:MAG: GLUG motif-containing protein, partial [Planctomycetota bacterium]
MSIKNHFRMSLAVSFFFLATLSVASAQYSGGSGTADDPYQIATAADLILLGETPDDYDKHFILTADIDLDPNLPGRRVFDKAVIAPDTDDTEYWFQGTRFEGVFDGNGHTISHLTIIGESYVGLFGQFGDDRLSAAELKNLGLEAVDVNGVGYGVGGLVGWNHRGSITNCYSTGSVIGGGRVGGLVGYSEAHISTSHSTATVNGTDWYVGGLVGRNSYGSITTSYSTGSVVGVDMVGGLVGRNRSGTITGCYSAGNVAGEADVGGLVGSNAPDWAPSTIIDCYSLGSVT